MIALPRQRMLTLATSLFAAQLLLCSASSAQNRPAPAAAGLPSETPAQFRPTNDGFDFARRDVMIPMRDGVRLHTVILVPRGAARAPMLLTRTPYDATALTSHAGSSHLSQVLNGYDNPTDVIVEGGYIRVVQDVRGKYGSEGDYVMNRPLRGPQNPTAVDHATDTYDTIEWLTHNVPWASPAFVDTGFMLLSPTRAALRAEVRRPPGSDSPSSNAAAHDYTTLR